MAEKRNNIVKVRKVRKARKLALLGLCLSLSIFAGPCLGEASGPAIAAGDPPGSVPQDVQAAALVWQVDDSNPSQPIVNSGSQFNIMLQTKVNSKDAQIGDSVQGNLVSDLFIGKKKIAGKGDLVSGFITSVDRARQSLKSDLPSHHWLDANGGLGLHFTQITTSQGQKLNIDALPKADSFIVEDNTSSTGTRPPLMTNKQGEVMIYYHNVRNRGLTLSIEGASIASCLALGPLGLLVAPAISGAAGLTSPSYAYDHPVNSDTTSHSRLKGMFRGMVEGLPGGFLISGAANHGLDVELSSGDELTLQLQSNLVVGS